MQAIFGPMTLPNNNAVGVPYNYIVHIPPSAFLANIEDVWAIKFRGPSSGQTNITACYVGTPNPSKKYAFVGDQVQVKVNGSPQFTLPAGSVVDSDYLDLPIQATIEGLTIAYEVVPSSNYARNNGGAGSGFLQCWKAGSGGAQSTNKTGYSVNANNFALIDSVVLIDETSPPPPPPPNPQPTDPEEPLMYPTLEQVDSGIAVSSGGVVEGTANAYTVFQFHNTSSSDVVLYLVKITPEATVRAIWKAVTDSIGTTLPKCNLKFGAGSVATLRGGQRQSKTGYFHAIETLQPSGSVLRPMIQLSSGRIVELQLQDPGIGAAANFEWLEL